MKLKRRYLIAVALLAILAVVFGLAGAVGSPSMSPSPASSPSVTHFVNPPSYDSGWQNITTMWGQNITLTHDLNTTDVVVDIVGKQSETDGEHQTNLGGTGYVPGWSRNYIRDIPDIHFDVGYSVVQTIDDGFAIAASTEPLHGDKISWLVKTDWVGNLQWNKTYWEGGDDEMIYAVIQTSDGGYAMAGYTDSRMPSDPDFWLVKTDASGNKNWSQLYWGTHHERAYSLIQTSDGGYAMTGAAWRPSSSSWDYWLVKTDPYGSGGWTQEYDNAGLHDYALSAIQTSDGGYALTGYTRIGSGNYDFWLVKTDSSGNKEWSQTYGGGNDDRASSVIQTLDGGYALGGYTRSYGAGGKDLWLVKTDLYGMEEWTQTYGGPYDEGETHDTEFYTVACTVVQTVDGGYALAGPAKSYGPDSDFWLVKTNSTGNVEWNITHPIEGDDYAYSMVYTNDGRFAMAGYTAPPFPETDAEWEVLLVRSSTESGLVWTNITNSTITLRRGVTDIYWNNLRVRIWRIQEPTWMFGDINQDGVVDAQDLLILSQNYGSTLSLLSLTGIIGILGVQTYKTRKRPK